MDTVAYTLIQKDETDELHLFEGKYTEPKKCTVTSTSVCRKMVKTEKDRIVFACQNEDEARLECAKLGRKVCGVCVSHLYTTYDG